MWPLGDNKKIVCSKQLTYVLCLVIRDAEEKVRSF